MCVLKMDSKVDEWILMKTCRHNPQVPITVFHQKTKKIRKFHPCWGKGDFKFSIKKPQKQWFSGQNTGLLS